MLAFAAACGSDAAEGSKGGALSCMPGTLIGCLCPGNTTGSQACEPDGASYSTCVCPGVGAAGSGGGVAGFGASTAGVGSSTAGSGEAGTFGGAGTGVAGTLGGAGTGAAGSGAAGTGVSVGGDEPSIPNVTAECPTLQTGTVQVLGQDVLLWVGQKQAGKKGQLLFYWHGTGRPGDDAEWELGSVISEITAGGGMVASFTTSTQKGQSTANNVWYTGDFEMADVLVKCAAEQLDIDMRRIYSSGCSAGGLQTGAMVTGRASYLAAAMPNSGGVITFFAPASDNPNHVPAVITAHGGAGDNVGVNFGETSADLNARVVAAGGFAVDCEHSSGHCGTPSAIKAAQWEFVKAHPFGVEPEPYANGLPDGFPAQCEIVQ